MQARHLSARSGRNWLREAYLLYRKNPPLLTSATMAYLLVACCVGFLPYIGPFLMSLIQPTLAVMLANVCAVIASGQPPTRAGLAHSLQERRTALLRVGGLQVAMSSCLLLVSMLIEYIFSIPTNLENVTADDLLVMLLPTFLLMVPMFMAFWFAPILTGWNNLPPLKAVFFSVIAVWRNLRAFGMYFLNILLVIMAAGFVVSVLSLLMPQAHDVFAKVMQFLLLMVMVPMLMASAFISYRDIFSNDDEPTDIKDEMKSYE